MLKPSSDLCWPFKGGASLKDFYFLFMLHVFYILPFLEALWSHVGKGHFLLSCESCFCVCFLSLSYMVFQTKCSNLLYLFLIVEFHSTSFIFIFLPQDCGSPTSPVNGTIELTDVGTTTYGATATQSCNIGFDLTGVTNITCRADGSWGDAAVTCTIKGNLYTVDLFSADVDFHLTKLLDKTNPLTMESTPNNE